MPSFRGATWCFGAGSIIRTDAFGSVAFRGETVRLLGSVYAPGGISSSPEPTSSRASRPAARCRPFSWQPGCPLERPANRSSRFIQSAGGKGNHGGRFHQYLRQHRGRARRGLRCLGQHRRPRPAADFPLDLELPGQQPARSPNGPGADRFERWVHPPGRRRVALLRRHPDRSAWRTVGYRRIADGFVGSLPTGGRTEHECRRNLIVRQSGLTLPPGVSRGIGQPLVDGAGTPLPALGNIAVSSFNRGGFDSLALGGNVRFSGQ